MIRNALILCLGLVLGATATFWLLDDPSMAPTVTSGREATAPAEPSGSESRSVVPARTEAGPATQAATPTAAEIDASLITPALREFASREMRHGWSTARRDAMPEAELAQGMRDYERFVLEQPQLIGRQLAQRHTKSEAALADARSGGAGQVLEKLAEGGVGPLPQLVREGGFDDLFRRMTADTPIKGELNWLKPDAALRNGYTLLFPPGVFRIEYLMDDANPFPRDVTIAGAGMNLTLIAVGNLSTRGPLCNFTIRDCTVHTRDHPLFDLRMDIATVTLERARFVGFDSAAGGSSLFATKPLALRAKACCIEGGYGRGRDGTIFDVRSDGLLARFDDCLISGVALHIARVRPGATVLFRSCTLRDILDDPIAEAQDKPGVAFESCHIERLPGSDTLRARDLNELFPNYLDAWNR